MISPCWDNVDYPVTQPFLPPPPDWRHCGIDIGCPPGTIIKAARTGVVETIRTGIVGIHVDGSTQRDFYLHGYPLVVVGQHVDAGTPVIHSDTVQVSPAYPLTGPHLHFEVQDGFTLPGAPPQAPGHPLDPVPVLEGCMYEATTGLPAGVPDDRTMLRGIYESFGNFAGSTLRAELQKIETAIAAISAGGLNTAQAAQLTDIQNTVHDIRSKFS